MLTDENCTKRLVSKLNYSSYQTQRQVHYFVVNAFMQYKKCCYIHKRKLSMFEILVDYIYICHVQVEILYKLQLVQEVCTSCNLYKQLVQVATCTG